jgi:transcriptional regulator with XRE-family HTH domain
MCYGSRTWLTASRVEGELETIRQARERRGWTQLQVAIQLGLTPVTIYNWERGKTEPRVSQFRQLARLLGVSMDDLALTGDQMPIDGSDPSASVVAEEHR